MTLATFYDINDLQNLNRYQSYLDRECCICQEALCQGNVNQLKPSTILFHDHGGEAHPMHARCIYQWVKEHHNCPICKKDVQIAEKINDLIRSNLLKMTSNRAIKKNDDLAVAAAKNQDWHRVIELGANMSPKCRGELVLNILNDDSNDADTRCWVVKQLSSTGKMEENELSAAIALAANTDGLIDVFNHLETIYNQ